MSIKENKELVTRYYEELRGGRDAAKVEAIGDKYFDPQFVYHLPSGEMNYARSKQIGQEITRAFPDMTTSIYDVIAEGDKVVVRYTLKGTHKGTFRGIPGTGKQFTQTGISIWRVKDGKFAECWTMNDTLGLMQQIGVIPAGTLK